MAQIDDDCALPDAGEQVAFAEEIASKTLAGPELVEWFPVTTETSINILIIPVQHGSFQHCVQVGASVNQDTGARLSSDVDYTTYCAGHPDEGNDTGDHQTWTEQATEWPDDLPLIGSDGRRRQRPSWMNSLIDPPGSSTVTPGSLTDYYRVMSNGRFELRGRVADYVYIPDTTITGYMGDPSPFPRWPQARSHEIISYIDANPGSLNLSSSEWDTYTNGNGLDRTPDGNFDMIVLLFRFSHLKGNTVFDANNITSLGYYCTTTTIGCNQTADSFDFDAAPLTLGGYNVRDNFESGSGVITVAQTKRAAIRIIAHEIGHRQYGLYHTDLVPEDERDHFSIMNGSSHLGFGAPDRIKAGWANIQFEDVATFGFKNVSLRDMAVVSTTEPDVIWIRDGSSACGDVVVESRFRSIDLFEAPGSDDGDLSDFYLPNEGLYFWKASTATSCGSSFRRYSSLPKQTTHKRWKFFGSNNDLEPGFGEGDVYDPGFLDALQYDFHESQALDDNLRVWNIVKNGDKFDFTISYDRRVDVKVFLQDSYSASTGQMSTALNNWGVISLSQPYNVLPWDHHTAESVTSMPPDAVDWVLIHLIHPTESAIVSTKAGLLDKSGNVSVLFTGINPGQYRVAVDHRNHLGIISASTIDLTGSNATIHFTQPGVAKVQGASIKDISGVKVMYAGDGNADGLATAPDFNLWNEETTAGATGYRKSDYNMDRQVTAPDFNHWNANTTAGARAPDTFSCAAYGKSCGSQGAQALATTEAYVRLNVDHSTGNSFKISVEIRRDGGLELENLGSAVVDMYYNAAELTYSSSVPGDLGTLLKSASLGSDEGGSYVRYQVRASGAIPVVPVGTTWERLVQHQFTRTPPPGATNTSIWDASLHLGFVENFPARIIRSVNVQIEATSAKGDVAETTSEEIPLEFSMDQNYPNPFNPVTQVSFGLPEKAHVRLAVFDMLGRMVRRQLDEDMEPGVHATTIDATDLPSGVYFFTIEAGAFRETRKMTVLR